MENLKEKLLEKIKSGEVQMVPRSRFLVEGVLWGAATVVAALIAVYLLSFILFALHENGIMFAPLFGRPGLILFIVSSPWILISVLGVFMLALYVLVSHYSFSYKKPLIYSIVGVVLIVIAVSSIIQQTRFHERTGNFAERHGVPGLAPLYRDVEKRSPKDVTKGTITQVAEGTFTVATKRGSEYAVLMNERTRMPVDTELAVGDSVIVFGPASKGIIEAFGVLIDDGTMPPPNDLGGE